MRSAAYKTEQPGAEEAEPHQEINPPAYDRNPLVIETTNVWSDKHKDGTYERLGLPKNSNGSYRTEFIELKTFMLPVCSSKRKVPHTERVFPPIELLNNAQCNSIRYAMAVTARLEDTASPWYPRPQDEQFLKEHPEETAAYIEIIRKAEGGPYIGSRPSASHAQGLADPEEARCGHR